MKVFTVNNTEFGWEEITAAAEVWGDWARLVEWTRQSLACQKYAVASGQLPDAKTTREALTAFRYAHNLISADETQIWLNRWEVSLEDLMSYLRGQLLIERWPGKLEEILGAHAVSDAEISQAIKSYAICADKLGEWAFRLAGHAAIAAKSGPFGAGDQGQRQAPRDLIACIETEFERERQQTVTPKQIETKIADHRLDWIRFDCRCLWFAEERIAREAVWCVTEDGLTLDEVAADARAEMRQWDFYLDEMEDSARPHFLAARQGDLLGPMKLQQGFPLFSIAAKKMPVADDPQIRERAERAILKSWTDQAIYEQVSWMLL